MRYISLLMSPAYQFNYGCVVKHVTRNTESAHIVNIYVANSKSWKPIKLKTIYFCFCFSKLKLRGSRHVRVFNPQLQPVV